MSRLKRTIEDITKLVAEAIKLGAQQEQERILEIMAKEVCQDCKAASWPNETHRLCWLTYYNIEKIKQ